jgi:hypothetical protein
MAIVRLDLPSGNWIDYRDNLLAADKFAVQDAIVFEYDDSDKRRFRAGSTNTMRNALLHRIITAWSYQGVPVPSQNIAGVETIGEMLDIDDYNALAEAVAPLLDKVAFTSAPNQQKSGS